MRNENEIVIYQASQDLQLPVRLEKDTVWLSIDQMAELFDRDKSVVGKHIRSIFAEGELVKSSVWAKNAYTASDGKTYQVDFYNLDVIISVGYRVKSVRGTAFRIWANKVLKEYLMRGYVFNQRFERIEHRLANIEERQDSFDLEIRASLPPREGIFFDGQIFDAYKFVVGLIEGAERKVVLIDNYVDESVLTMLDKRKNEVTATIYTAKVDKQMKLDIEKHNAQYTPINVQPFNKAHDRFLLIDEVVYHIGASLKDLGKKWFAFTKMNDITSQDLLEKMK